MKMTHESFIEMCKYKVCRQEVKAGRLVSPEDVFVVWSCKALQNSKCLMSTPMQGAAYYEATLDGDTGVTYFCAYEKTSQNNYDTSGNIVRKD